jgi:chemotaxis protein methyltransferase CheR
MKPRVAEDIPWSHISNFIAERTGLHFPTERQGDLERGVAAAARDLGFADIATCAQLLLSNSLTKKQFQALANHLTVGETYFFREQATFDILKETILPRLLRAKAGGERRLRIWSAACCTGEEPYSLAILLDNLIPNLADWRVTILATDINTSFLQKAAAGVYGEWSFRDAPDWLKTRYFKRTVDGRYAIVPEIKKRVTFANLNLVEDVYPSLATDTNAMNLIFCRNALMYFTLPQARKAVQKLRCSLVDDAWLVVSPSESSQVLFSQFAPANFPGVILYQKTSQTGYPAPAPVSSRNEPAELNLSSGAPPAPVDSGEVIPPMHEPTPLTMASLHYENGHYADAAGILLTSLAECATPDPQSFSLLSRALANQGRLSEALAWCDRWVGADKLDPSGHYLRAVVLQELGELDLARHSLQRALYLQPDFVLANFALANLARSRGLATEADKYFATALRLLRRCKSGNLLPESDGLTAGRLIEIISSLTTLEATP